MNLNRYGYGVGRLPVHLRSARGVLCLLAWVLFLPCSWAGSLISDDFSQGPLQPGVWTFVNPLSDGSASVTGNVLRINVPQGVSHDIWTGGNQAPRVMQGVDDTDFVVQAKFESAPLAPYQLQGLLVEADAETFIRFDMYSDGFGVNLFAARFVAGNPVVEVNQPITSSAIYYLRVSRVGDQWTYSYSLDGGSWDVGASFSHPLTVTGVGVFAGNAGPNPAFTAVVDYVFNNASPIDPEDGPSGPGPLSTLVSDDFSAPQLNPALWTFVNPLSDGSVNITGNELRISVPGGVSHDVWTSGNDVPRVMQSVNNADFEVEAKFVSVPQPAYQLQGFLIEQDSGNLLRFDMYSNGAGVNLFAASLIGGTPVVQVNQAIAASAAYYLRVTRQGNQWTYSYSLDGVSWIVGASFTQTLAVSQVGVFAGNAGTSPAFTAVVDYFFNTASPIDPEDGGSPPPSTFVSDEFTGLDTNLWTIIDPLADGTVSVIGSTLHLEVPAGVGHDVWTGGNQALRVMQTVNDTDFEVDVKFNSVPQEAYQLQGLLVEQDSDNFIRFDLYSDGVGVNLFAASFVAGNPVVQVNQPIGVAEDYFLRVKRQGNTWTYSYSLDGEAWVVGASFSRQLAVGQVGLFAGNAGSNPAFTARVDYVLNTITPGGGGEPMGLVVSDDFSAGGLNTGLWTFVNPLGDASVDLTENALEIVVPEGANHDIWTSGNFAPRVMQVVDDLDFEVEAKFFSRPQQRYQVQGFVVEQDAANFIRFDIYSDGTGVKLFAASFAGASPTVLVNAPIDDGVAYHLRVKRQGNQWTFSCSLDGMEWIVGADFDQPLAVTQVGLFGANAGDNPAFTVLVDYFLNTSSPIVPEDGGLITLSVQSTAGGSVIRNPDLTHYSAGDFVELTAVPAPNWEFVEWRGGISGTTNPVTLSLNQDVEAQANFAPTNAAAIIDVWHGDDQVVGFWGVPQRWANVLGQILVPSQVVSLSYDLNGQFQSELSFRSGSNPRLAQDGDFNVELDYQSLPPGTNQVTLTATLQGGAQFSRNVLVYHDAGHQWPLGYPIDWTAVSEINDVAQVVDGDWIIEAGGVRPAHPHYDRQIAIGDVLWTDYEATVPITVHGVVAAPPGYAPAVGLLLRWQGHFNWENQQPRVGWHPLGAIGWFAWSDPNALTDPALSLLENDGTRVSSVLKPFSFGTRYMFKMRVETVPQPSIYKAVYRLKVWPDGQTEPAAWDIVHSALEGADAGSLTLLSHYTDATFGDVMIVPIPEE